MFWRLRYCARLCPAKLHRDYCAGFNIAVDTELGIIILVTVCVDIKLLLDIAFVIDDNEITAGADDVSLQFVAVHAGVQKPFPVGIHFLFMI